MSKKTLNVKWKSDKNPFLSNQKFQVRVIEKRSAILAITNSLQQLARKKY